MRKIFVTVVGLGFLAAACGGDGGTPTTTAAGVNGGPQIVMEGRAFSGVTEVTAGTKVTVVNKDDIRHSVTSKESGLFEVVVDGGGTGELALDQPGTYDFFCKFHSSMTAQIVVT